MHDITSANETRWGWVWIGSCSATGLDGERWPSLPLAGESGCVTIYAQLKSSRMPTSVATTSGSPTRCSIKLEILINCCVCNDASERAVASRDRGVHSLPACTSTTGARRPLLPGERRLRTSFLRVEGLLSAPGRTGVDTGVHLAPATFGQCGCCSCGVHDATWQQQQSTAARTAINTVPTKNLPGYCVR